jgi:hypothetical protein
MPDYNGMWVNPLLTATILNASRENKSEFGQKSQGRLEQNPPVGPQYPPLITASRAALDLFITAKDGTSLGLQKAATERLDAMLPVIRTTGEVLEGRLKSEFESDPSVITEFFPNGRTAISNAKRGDVISALNNWVARATEREPILGAAWVTRLTNLRTQWLTNLDAQSGKISRVSSSRSEFDQAWETLSWAFFDIAQQLAVANPRNENVIKAFFDFSVFEGKSNSDTDGSGFLYVLLMAPDFAPIINANYKVNDMEGNLVASGTTDGEGKIKENLPTGFYRVAANQVGFLEGFKQIQVLDDNDPLHEMFLERA